MNSIYPNPKPGHVYLSLQRFRIGDRDSVPIFWRVKVQRVDLLGNLIYYTIAPPKERPDEQHALLDHELCATLDEFIDRIMQGKYALTKERFRPRPTQDETLVS